MKKKGIIITILGSGLSGMISALHLVNANYECISEIIIIEKKDKPGGLMKTTYKNDMFWDDGAYLFEESDFLVKLLPDSFKKVEDWSQNVWLSNKSYKFPFEIKDFLKNRKANFYLKLGFDYLISLVKLFFEKENVDLKCWLENRLTKTIVDESKIAKYFTKLQSEKADKSMTSS